VQAELEKKRSRSCLRRSPPGGRGKKTAASEKRKEPCAWLGQTTRQRTFWKKKKSDRRKLVKPRKWRKRSPEAPDGRESEKKESQDKSRKSRQQAAGRNGKAKKIIVHRAKWTEGPPVPGFGAGGEPLVKGHAISTSMRKKDRI